MQLKKAVPQRTNHHVGMGQGTAGFSPPFHLPGFQFGGLLLPPPSPQEIAKRGSNLGSFSFLPPIWGPSSPLPLLLFSWAVALFGFHFGGVATCVFDPKGRRSPPKRPPKRPPIGDRTRPGAGGWSCRTSWTATPRGAPGGRNRGARVGRHRGGRPFFFFFWRSPKKKRPQKGKPKGGRIVLQFCQAAPHLSDLKQVLSACAKVNRACSMLEAICCNHLGSPRSSMPEIDACCQAARLLRFLYLWLEGCLVFSSIAPFKNPGVDHFASGSMCLAYTTKINQYIHIYIYTPT